MLRKMRIAAASLFMVAGFVALGLGVLGQTAFAATDEAKKEACLAITDNPADCADAGKTEGGNTINGVITTVIDIFSVVVGVVAVIMIIVAGFKYITSGGDSSKVSSAKTTLVYALVGLVIVALAQVISNFTLDTVNHACVDGQHWDSTVAACIDN